MTSMTSVLANVSATAFISIYPILVNPCHNFFHISSPLIEHSLGWAPDLLLYSWPSPINTMRTQGQSDDSWTESSFHTWRRRQSRRSWSLVFSYPYVVMLSSTASLAALVCIRSIVTNNCSDGATKETSREIATVQTSGFSWEMATASSTRQTCEDVGKSRSEDVNLLKGVEQHSWLLAEGETHGRPDSTATRRVGWGWEHGPKQGTWLEVLGQTDKWHRWDG